MAGQTIKYCPKCKDSQYFEWQIEKDDTNNNNLDFWLMCCCCCGYTATESTLDEYSILNQDKVFPTPLSKRVGAIFEEATNK